MRKATIVLVVLAMAAFACPAWGAAKTWVGGSGDEWRTDANWVPDAEPTSADQATISGGASVRVGESNSAIAGAAADTLAVGTSGGGTATLEVWGHGYGTNATFTTGGQVDVYAGSTVNMTSGWWKPDGGIVVHADALFNVSATGNGFMRYSSGNIKIYGEFNHTGGKVNPKSGTYYIGDCTGVDPASGKFVSSGTADTRLAYLQIGDGGAFEVVGWPAWVQAGGVSAYVGTQWTQESGGTLKCVIKDDGAGNVGIRKIMVGRSGVGGTSYSNAVFKSGSILDMEIDGATVNVNDYFDLLTTYGQINDKSLGLHADDQTDWVISWHDTDSDGADDTLRVTYVPEPAALALLGIGGLGALIRRKRR